jgi:ribonuclease HI
VEGRRDGVGGAVIFDPGGGRRGRGVRAAGRASSSTAAEAAGVIAGLQALDGLLPPPPAHVWILFDSRALLQRLQAPPKPSEDAATREIRSRSRNLGTLGYALHYCWVPGHCGLPGNEAADGEATGGAAEVDEEQDDVPSSLCSVKAALAEWAREKWREAYEDACTAPDASPSTRLHFEITAGEALDTSLLSRKDATSLHQLRLGRAAFLQATKHRYGIAEDDLCPHCGEAPEDTKHFIETCPRWERERRLTIGSPAHVTCLQNQPQETLAFIKLCSHRA